MGMHQADECLRYRSRGAVLCPCGAMENLGLDTWPPRLRRGPAPRRNRRRQGVRSVPPSRGAPSILTSAPLAPGCSCHREGQHLQAAIQLGGRRQRIAACTGIPSLAEKRHLPLAYPAHRFRTRRQDWVSFVAASWVAGVDRSGTRVVGRWVLCPGGVNGDRVAGRAFGPGIRLTRGALRWRRCRSCASASWRRTRFAAA